MLFFTSRRERIASAESPQGRDVGIRAWRGQQRSRHVWRLKSRRTRFRTVLKSAVNAEFLDPSYCNRIFWLWHFLTFTRYGCLGYTRFSLSQSVSTSIEVKENSDLVQTGDPWKRRPLRHRRGLAHNNRSQPSGRRGIQVSVLGMCTK